MSGDAPQSKPNWQTDDLDEEWIEQSDDDNDAATSSSMDETEPHPGSSVGTFLVREEVAPSPIMPKTPGRNKKNVFIKDFFSPLALERMFEPPSPPSPTSPTSPAQNEISQHLPPPNPSAPAVPSRLSRVHYPDQSGETERDGHGDVSQQSGSSLEEELEEGQTPPAPQSKFTFHLPVPSVIETDGAQAQSTPMPLRNGPAPSTDPRLRLFQFQYDTFTRDHLSALVDSLVIPASQTGSSSTPDASDSNDQGQFRSTKRIKLSPASDLGELSHVPMRRDYVGESKSLMQQIRHGARDVSRASIKLDGSSDVSSPDSDHRRTPANHLLLQPPPLSSEPSSDGTKRSTYSSFAYRAQAADLMAQLKKDMRTHKRLFSTTSDGSHTTHVAPEEDKENVIDRELTKLPIAPPPSVAVLSVAAIRFASPRKILRRLSAADEVDRELAQELSGVSITPPEKSPRKVAVVIRDDVSTGPPSPANVLTNGMLAPPPVVPALPTGTIRSTTNDDLNRFVSSSTTTGTTLTVGSVPSFTKHAGPTHMTHIRPGDLPPLPNRVGKMVFDTNMMKWVKETALATAHVSNHLEDADADSEDPFRDIESLQDDSGRSPLVGGIGPSQAEEAVADGSEDAMSTDVEGEEHDLTSFSFDDPTAGVVQVMTGIEDDLSAMDDENLAAAASEGFSRHDDGGHDDDDDGPTEQVALRFQPAPAGGSRSPPARSHTEPPVTPVPAHRGPAFVPRSALKSANATPVSAMKDTNVTPVAQHGHRRSVSFSDGKTEGKIAGLGRNGLPDNSVAVLSEPPSAQTRRIQDMLDALEEPSYEEEDDSPSKTSQHSGPSVELPLFSERAGAEISRRTFARSPSVKLHNLSRASNANATFLTECSFGVAHDRLVQVITDVQPFEPYWSRLTSIDLSGKNIDSVVRLKEFLPNLSTLYLSSNQLAWLSGVPGSVRTLSVARNVLTSVTSFHHLRNLQSLDISHNEIDSLCQLSELRHLQELKADGNQIASCDGLQAMEALVKLSVQGNRLTHLDATDYDWTKLEMLNVADNALTALDGLTSLQRLVALNADNNALTALGSAGAAMPRLRILRASGNRLAALDVGAFPNLKTLYADGNALGGVTNGGRLAKLESLSLRNQIGRVPALGSRDVRDVRRLYLSGNPIVPSFLAAGTQPCYNLLYLELAGCRLTELPGQLASTVPNVRVVNLNYNFLADLGALAGLRRIRKLSVVGGKVASLGGVVRVLREMPEMEMVDLRMNPGTLAWYVPVLVPSQAEGSKGDGGGWAALDGKFRRDLSDSAYVGRLAWRGKVMEVCPRVREVDGLEVSEKERAKAREVLAALRGSRAGP